MRLKIIIIAVALLVACTPTGQVVKETQARIGGAFILSGIGADWGTAEKNSAELAVSEYNAAHDKKVELVIEGIQYDNTNAVLGLQKLVSQDNVQVVVVSWLDGLQGMAAAAEDSGTVLISPSASVTALKAEQPYPHSFVVWYRTDAEAASLSRYLESHNKTRVALVYGSDPFWTDFKQQFTKAARANVTSYSVNGAENDYRTLLTQLKHDAPDAILFGLDNEGAIYNFLKQRQEYYPDSDIYTTEMIEGYLAREEFRPVLERVSFVKPAGGNQSFADKYRKAYGNDPVSTAYTSYDATNMILQAINAGNTDGESIKSYLETHEFDTVTFGKVRFDTIHGVTGGKFQVDEIENSTAALKP